jgi:hypothetical protein
LKTHAFADEARFHSTISPPPAKKIDKEIIFLHSLAIFKWRHFSPVTAKYVSGKRALRQVGESLQHKPLNMARKFSWTDTNGRTMCKKHLANRLCGFSSSDGETKVFSS